MIKFSWSIFPRFMQLIILVFGIKMMIYVTEYAYPFELVAWGLIAIPMIFLISFFEAMHDDLKD